ncbi:hypothetical protein PATSB16_41500 [Pandoraea thiooxydans]|nr:hypothetical protein PATSB16_41500 [Pandoraea thiooxydans]
MSASICRALSVLVTLDIGVVVQPESTRVVAQSAAADLTKNSLLCISFSATVQ